MARYEHPYRLDAAVVEALLAHLNRLINASNWGWCSKSGGGHLHGPSKSIAVNEQANDDVVHLRGFREADGLTNQALNARP